MSGSVNAGNISVVLTADASELTRNMAQAATVVEAATQRMGRSAAAAADGTKAITAANDNAADGMRRFGELAGAAGEQLKDLVTQSSSGAAALTSLGAKAAEALGTFGPAGVLAGAALTAIVGHLTSVQNKTQDIIRTNEAWRSSVNAIRDAYDTATERARRLNAERQSGAVNTQRGIMEGAQSRAEEIGARSLDLQEQLESARRQRATLPSNTGMAARATDRTIADLERRLASLRGDGDIATREVQAAREEMDRAANGPGRALLTEAREDAAAARRLRGLTPARRPIEEARIQAEREIAERNITDETRKREIIEARVAAARDRQANALGREGQQSADRMADALKMGETEIIRSREKVALTQALANAESPRARVLAEEAAAVEEVTVRLRGRMAAQTDPAIRTALQGQIDDIRKLREAEIGLREEIRNRSALWQQAATLERQGAERQAMGMTPEERAAYLGRLNEQQRIEGEGGSLGTAEAAQRIRNATDIALGSEQMTRLKEFQDGLRGIGSAFGDAALSMATGGKKMSDVLKTLETSVASLIYRMTVGKMLEKGFSALGSNLFGAIFGTGGKQYDAPIGPTIDGVGLPARAAGGPIMAGGSYLVGENGPEIFSSNVSGQIVPNGRTPAGGGDGGGMVFQIDARGADAGSEQRIKMVLMQSMPGIIAAAQQNAIAQANRGGSYAKAMGRRS